MTADGKGRVLFVLLATSTAASGPALAKDDCAQASDRAQIECLGRTIEVAQKTLDGLYQAALTKLPEQDPNDVRKDKAQLVKAERSWQAFMQDNCAYVGAVEGGSNLWVSNFAARCQLDEIGKRIGFFNHTPAKE